MKYKIINKSLKQMELNKFIDQIVTGEKEYKRDTLLLVTDKSGNTEPYLVVDYQNDSERKLLHIRNTIIFTYEEMFEYETGFNLEESLGLYQSLTYPVVTITKVSNMEITI